MINMMLSLLQVTCRSPWALPSSPSLHAAGRCQPLLPSCRYTLQEGSISDSVFSYFQTQQRAGAGSVVCTVCMYAKPVLVSSICWVCIGCVCMGTRAETSKYSQLELALSKYSRVFLSNSRESTVLLLCFFLLFWHILAAAAVCYSFLQRKLSKPFRTPCCFISSRQDKAKKGRNPSLPREREPPP